MKFYFKTDLQQTQNGFQMCFLFQNMCLVNVEIAGKFQVSICIRYKFIALKGSKNVPSVTAFA